MAPGNRSGNQESNQAQGEDEDEDEELDFGSGLVLLVCDGNT